MRLKTLAKRLPLKDRLLVTMARLLMGGRDPGILITIRHRPAFFGPAQMAAVQRALRGPSQWSPGQRELFAAFVSRQNQCPF